MKIFITVKTIAASTLIALTLGCGYSSKTATPVAGTMPTIAQLNPTDATAGGAAFTLTVNGTNFNSNASVNWNGSSQSAGTKYVSGSQLTVSVPASAIMSAGTVQVTVTNPGSPGTGLYGTGATQAETSNAMTFTIN
jgi:hypothetical protein